MKIGIIGSGNMSRAIVLGLISSKTKADRIMVSDIDEKKLSEEARRALKAYDMASGNSLGLPEEEAQSQGKTKKKKFFEKWQIGKEQIPE